MTSRSVPTPAAVALGLLAGYVAGSVSFSRLLGERLVPGEDLSVTMIEVREAGATVEFHGVTPTSVKEHAGTAAMMTSVGLEAAKAALATLLVRAALPDSPAAPAAATGAVVGHVLPVWSSFQGGYGMSPMLGGMLVLDPVGLAVTTGAVSGLIGVTRDRRLMMLWPLAVPAWEAARGRADLFWFGVAANTVYWARLVPELRRSLRPILNRPSRPGGRGDEE